jgi:eukaryotic-like serine/threonine-protein kinase
MEDSPDISSQAPKRAQGSLTKRAFVGRVREAEILRSAVREAMEGRGQLIILSGEPGIGKTRLAEETANFATSSGAHVFWGRCWEGGGAPPFWPWIQLIRESLSALSSQILSEANQGLAYIAHMVPELHSGMPVQQQSARESAGGLQLAGTSMQPEERFLLFDAVSGLLKKLAAAAPLMIVLDDLHAADEDSLLLLRFIAREVQQTRILLAATYREVEIRRSHQISALLAEIGREGSTISLRGLSALEVAEFFERNGKLPVDETTISSLYQATDGNPFFLDEIVRLATTGNDSARAKLDSGFSVPDSVRATIRRRMASLAEQTRTILTIASLIGQEFDLALLRDVSGVASEQLIESCDEAVTNVLIGEVSGTVGRYRFIHAMTAEALRADFGTAARARLHQRIAAAMEKIYRDDIESHLAQVAHHYVAALPLGDVDKAIEFARRGAQRARDQLAFAEAARLYGMALRAIMAGPQRDDTARCELLLELGETQAQGRSLEEARQSFEQAAEVARRLERSDLLSRAALSVSTWFGSFFSIDDALKAMLAEALAAIGPNDTPIRATLMAKLAGEFYWSGEHERGRALCDEAVAVARRTGDARALVSAAWVQNEINWGPENVEARLAAATEIAALAESVGDYHRALRAHEMRFTALLEMGDTVALTSEVNTYRALAEKWGEQFGIVERFNAALALLKGDFNDAERQIEELWRHARRRQDPALLTCAGYLEEFIATEQAQIDPARLESTRKAQIALSPSIAIVGRVGLALLYAATGRRAEAEAELESLAKDDFAAIPRNWNWLANFCWLALVCIGVNDVERAGFIYESLLPYASRNATIGWGDMSYGCVGRFLGMLAWKIGKLEEAQTHFEQALRFEQRMGSRLWAAYTQFEYGRMLFKRHHPGDSEAARNLIQQALDAASNIGLKLLEMRAAALVAKAYPPEPIPSPEPLAAPEFGSHVVSGRTGQRQRIVATIMFVDIVSSTERVTEMKDRRWTDIRSRFFELLRKELTGVGGREIQTAGDGMLAIFDQPATAIRAAFAMSEGVRNLGLQIRTGIHTGECEIVEGDIAGIAVHIGARVTACAGANEVVVSNTVRELMAGGDTKFKELGRHVFKGVPGEWNLYSVERSE